MIFNWGGGTKCGIPVISVKELKDKYNDALLVISPRYCWEEIKRQLIDDNIENEYVILSNVIDNTVGRQYFNCSAIKPQNEEIFVDAGVLNGADTKTFFQWAGNSNKYAYLFEPNKNVVNAIKNNLKTDNYKLITKGLWNKETTLCFQEGEGNNVGGFTITDERTEIISDVTTLDKTLIDVPVTFIKMDIEGAEYNALLGGEKLIRKYRPRLAICVYHNPEDIIEIPKLIMEINPNYKFYLRHYNFAWSETVLYAVTE